MHRNGSEIAGNQAVDALLDVLGESEWDLMMWLRKRVAEIKANPKKPHVGSKIVTPEEVDLEWQRRMQQRDERRARASAKETPEEKEARLKKHREYCRLWRDQHPMKNAEYMRRSRMKAANKNSNKNKKESD